MDTQKLKAEAYDLLAMRQNIDAKLAQINQEIAKQAEVQPQEQKPKKDK